MSESEKKVEIKGSNLPLEPIVASDDSEYAEIKAAYDTLLAECRRIDEIRSSQVEGASWSLDKDKRIYSVDEYNEMLAAYKSSRKAYIERYKAKLETIDMVREKIRKIEEEEAQFDRENPMEDDAPEVPDFEDIPDEPWEDFCKRNEAYWAKLRASMEKTQKQLALARKRGEFMKRRLDEEGKFGELEYEMEFRLRHTYIDPKTGEAEYRPDDDVGEGLICVGSRDYNPRREDFDDWRGKVSAAGGRGEYGLFSNNCHAFTCYCITGENVTEGVFGEAEIESALESVFNTTVTWIPMARG